MSRRRSPALWGLATALVLLGLASAAAAIPVRIRAAATVHAHARFDEDGSLVLRGRLRDDGGAPIAAGRIAVALPTELATRLPTSCDRPRQDLSRTEREVRLQTSVRGEFCARWRRPSSRGRLEVRFDGDRYHSAARVELGFDRSAPPRLPTRLRFDPRPASVDLDLQSTALTGVLTTAEPQAHVDLAGLSISLETEGGRRLAQAQTGGDGKARFELPSASLGTPGHGVLVLRFGGSEALEPAQDSQPVTRRATARLRLVRPVEPGTDGEPPVATIALEAPVGKVSGGVVEAVYRGRSAGTAPVEAGAARLVLNLPSRRQPVAASVRYLPASPWWRPGPALRISVPPPPRSLAWQLVLSLLVAGAGAWALGSWRRSRALPHKAKPPARLTPGIHVIETARSGAPPAWRGTVVDAHEGRALGGASIAVVQPTAPGCEDASPLVRCTADARGQFHFTLAERPPSAELVVRLPTHAAMRKPLPPPGTLRIALLTWRRNILRRFVDWARRRGGPFFAPPEPTPAQVRKAGARDPELVAWAQAVEAAAFGPRDVGETTEQQLRAMEPVERAKTPSD